MTTRRAVAQALSLLTFVVATFLLAVYANAQVEQGRFVGRIVDSQDAGVPGASVTVTNTGKRAQPGIAFLLNKPWPSGRNFWRTASPCLLSCPYSSTKFLLCGRLSRLNCET